MPNEEIPESLRGYFEKKDEPAPEKGADSATPASLQEYFNTPQAAATQVGHTAQLADTISPLSVMQRSALGWATPSQRLQFLEQSFGKGNVQLSKMDDDAGNFIIKTDDGKWHQADPHGISDIPMDVLSGNLGQALNRIKNFNLHNTIGGAAQFVGEKGAVSLGATLGAGEAMAAGAPLILASGPAAPLTAMGLGVMGGYMGGGAASLIEQGTRKALDEIQKATGEQILGASSPSLEDFSHKVMGDMFFGGMQELAAPFLNATVNKVGMGAAKILGKGLSMIGDTPASKQALATLIKMGSGMKEGLARVFAEDPEGVAVHLPRAIEDRTNNTDSLKMSQKSDITNLVTSSKEALRGSIGKEYDAIETYAKGRQFNALAPSKSTGDNALVDGMNELIEKRFIRQVERKGDPGVFFQDRTGQNHYLDAPGETEQAGGGWEVEKKRVDKMVADTDGANGRALNDIINGMEVLNKKKGVTTYEDLKLLRQRIDNHLSYGDDPVKGNLRDILGKIRTGIKNIQGEALYEMNPKLSNRLFELDKTYGPAKDLIETLASKAEDQRVDAFLKQVIRDDGSYNAELMNSIQELLPGVQNPSKRVLQKQVALESVPWLKGTNKVKIAGIPLPLSPRATANATIGLGIPMQQAQSAGTDAAMGALKMGSRFYRALPDSLRKDFIQNPAAISTLGGMMSGAVIQEQTDKSKLLDEAGAFQNSQFGQ